MSQLTETKKSPIPLIFEEFVETKKSPTSIIFEGLIGYQYNYMLYRCSDTLYVKATKDKIQIFALSEQDAERFEHNDILSDMYRNDDDEDDESETENSDTEESDSDCDSDDERPFYIIKGLKSPGEYFQRLVYEINGYLSIVEKTFTAYEEEDDSVSQRTLLVEVEPLTYIHIGPQITKFKTDKKIITYIHPKFRENWHVEPMAFTEDEMYYISEGKKYNINEMLKNSGIQETLKRTHKNFAMTNMFTDVEEFENYTEFKKYHRELMKSKQPAHEKYIELLDRVVEYSPCLFGDNVAAVPFEEQTLFEIYINPDKWWEKNKEPAK
jgi:hypothetical protein